MTINLWVNPAIKLGSIGLIAYLSGLLVERHNVRVNYTRKINFFALFAIPMSVDWLVPHRTTGVFDIVCEFLFIGLLLLFLKPVRDRLPLAETMFRSYDRPEDRPYTLLWLVTQLIAGYVVIVPMTALLRKFGAASLMFIPVLVHGFGDGLAEPVGVRFGAHKYATRAIFSDRRYTRSLEGSACVFAAGVIAVAAFYRAFTPIQFCGALLVLPISMTLAEAASPHTWDTPLMFLVGGLVLLGCVTLL